jgi:tetratricopeptide (TPR) repeat protein
LAIEKNPRDTTARYGLGLVLRQIDRTEEAEAEFARVQEVRNALERAVPLRDRIKSDPTDLDARLQLGELLLEHESEKMGIFWLRSVFTYDPNHSAAHKVLAEYYRSQSGSAHKAMADFHTRAASKQSEEKQNLMNETR